MTDEPNKHEAERIWLTELLSQFEGQVITADLINRVKAAVKAFYADQNNR